DSDQNGMNTLPIEVPLSISTKAKKMTCAIRRRIADGPRIRWKRTARSRPPKTGSSAWARTTASMAIAIRVTDHSTVTWESPRHGQKPGGIPAGNRPAIQRTVVMIREPVVNIQPGRHASRLGTHLLRAFRSIMALGTLPKCPFQLPWANSVEVVEAVDLIWMVRHSWFTLGDPLLRRRGGC